MAGPLQGLKVLEIASLAPGPFAVTMLADMGAEVLRVDRATAVGGTAPADPPLDPLGRGRRSVAVDLKDPAGVEVVLQLAAQADVLVEGFRPGVCERLGFGPEQCAERNPGLIFARLTGYGQDGPLSQAAGHDLTYLAYSGALHPIGPMDGPPVPPVNYVADFGGGAMMLVAGVLAALYERQSSGRGQVVDTAMSEGAAMLTSMLHGWQASGFWPTERGGAMLDGSAPFYRCYTCADGQFMAVGAIEPQFYDQLLTGLGLGAGDVADRNDPSSWPALTETFTTIFASRTREEWTKVFDGTDACVAPVLSPAEAVTHPHAVARGSFVQVAGMTQPGPAPRLTRTPSSVRSPAPHPGQHTRAALIDWGVGTDEVDALLAAGAVRSSAT
ncbi:CaiB/BaiF CoA-transferase family protein [Rhodococcus sp. X156]|uniref:CaiB/BaiF CoA transferase family protein n=1 Tax=Rhodococcus sp. X156 TaxID=2499145 RepID=UPI001F497E57|nr:CaiB/BaiF CoA-transferase family protein [Rhodococcus sp. X156]